MQTIDSDAMRRRRKVLAVSSSGGHWTQLQRLVPAFDDCELLFVTTQAGYAAEVAPRPLRVVRDATRWDRIGCLVLLFQILALVVGERPDVVITTGAAPGFFAVLFGWMLGARTIWVDSIANVERLSLSGRLVRPFAGLWLTQWPAVAGGDGRPEYAGAVF